MKVASVLVTKRKRRGEHVTVGKALNTNRLAKWYGFYCSLKAITESGQIKDFYQQIDLIKAVSAKSSTTTVYNYIHNCEKAGLLRKVGRDIFLVSWERAFNKAGFFLSKDTKENIQFLEFYYASPNQIKASPELHIEAAEIAERSWFSLHAIARKINQNVQLKSMLGIKPEQNATIEDAKKLFELQLESFTIGKADGLVTSEEGYEILHSVQACPFRKVQSLVSARKQGNLRATVAFIARIKRKFAETGLAIVQDLSCISEQRKRANSEFYFRGWDQESKAAFWNLPTEVSVFAKFPEMPFRPQFSKSV
ncbi:MAG: hypothetical protein LCH37_14840 [Bacteroidetes bacterium]|nr:hypothetical protein [Bacteroidota bacterium]